MGSLSMGGVLNSYENVGFKSLCRRTSLLVFFPEKSDPWLTVCFSSC